MQKSHRKVVVLSMMVALFMFGFCFALVPFYSRICKVMGLNTAAQSTELLSRAYANEKELQDMTREITVQFITTNHMGMTWDFYPHVKSLKVHPGENVKTFFYAKNTSNHLMTVQAIPSMTPTDAISHFHKIECFCFKQQTLKGYESKEMPLIFNVDQALPREIHTITLAYTLFDVTKNATRKG